MPIDKDQLRELIINVTKAMESYSEASTNLLMGTAAQESHLGTYIKQINGPALGIFQMEPSTEIDIWRNYLSYRGHFIARINQIANVKGPDHLHLKGNLIYQIMMARYHYMRAPKALPNYDDIYGIGSYWKYYYNTEKGKGTVDEFVMNYNRYVRD